MRCPSCGSKSFRAVFYEKRTTTYTGTLDDDGELSVSSSALGDIDGPGECEEVACLECGQDIGTDLCVRVDG